MGLESDMLANMYLDGAAYWSTQKVLLSYVRYMQMMILMDISGRFNNIPEWIG
jgi:hypothetical protein